ncbi:MAG: NUDIX domain-containing protein [Myxococcales bacterium]|nr:NUDIX domain-containing protein [Myxococcales bacterium]
MPPDPSESRPLRRFHVGAKAVITRGPSILLLHEAGRDAWDLPGGRVEGRETLPQALRRELDEELPGIDELRIGEQLGSVIVSAIDGDPGLLLVLHAVEARLPPAIRTSASHRAHAWVPVDEARRRLAPELAALLPGPPVKGSA